MKIFLPVTDFCAKELFANEIIRKYFISDITGIPISQIRAAYLCNPFLRRRYRRQKQGVLDVLVELDNCTKINIEIQVKSQSYWAQRNLFYLSKMYTEGLHERENYTKLKKCIAISLLDFNVTSSGICHSVFQLRDAAGASYTDLFEVHIIELKKKLTGDSSVDDWVRFFRAKTEEDLDMIITKNPGINMAIKEVKRMSLSERMRAKYEAYLKEVRDQNTWEEYLRDEGRAEGRVEGQTEGCMIGSNQEKEKIINRLLGKGKRPEEIAELLGYSLQEIEDIQRRVMR